MNDVFALCGIPSGAFSSFAKAFAGAAKGGIVCAFNGAGQAGTSGYGA